MGKWDLTENCITCLQVPDNSEANHLGHLWINDPASEAQGEGILTIYTQKRTACPCTQLKMFQTLPHAMTPKLLSHRILTH